MTNATEQSLDVINGVHYPSSDGESMAETDIHVLAIMLLFQAVKDFLRDQAQFYVAANIFWYWEEGVPASRCSPDVMVVRGVDDHLRRSFRSWQENNVVPRVIFEISSEETWRGDLTDKRELYARLGVREYFLFDPEALYLDPPLRGFRLQNGVLVELSAAADGSLLCQELGVRLIRERQMLRLIDPQTGAFVLTREERAEQERERAEQERKRAKQERKRAKQEQQGRQQAEAEVERLKQLLAKLMEQKNGGSTPS